MSDEVSNISPEQDDFDAAALEKGRWLFAQSCDFLLGVTSLEALPAGDRPEIAFAGRSNVGKSSLVNALTGRKTLARTSNTPGRTRELNFFSLTPGLYLVDLPGYGYAKVERELSKRWVDLLKEYLRGRMSLRRVMILVDSRHGLKPSDLEMMDMLDVTAVSYQIVLTKADKIKAGKAEATRKAVERAIIKRPAAHPNVLLTSSQKKTGIEELRAELASLADWTLISYSPKSAAT